MGAMQSTDSLLLIEDDPSMAGALKQVLKSSYSVETAITAKQALYKADIGDYDLIVLDLNLPDTPGLTVCQMLRERNCSAAILVLSGESKVLTKIQLLDAGANDYLTKPFSLGELKARLRVLSRANQLSVRQARLLTVGSLTLDRFTRTACRDGQLINLRRKEFAILECLMENAGSVVTRDTLKTTVWPDMSELWTNTVDVHVKHLRDKIDRPFDEPLIRTAHGLGYRLAVKQMAALGDK